jgi:glycolate oxidase
MEKHSINDHSGLNGVPKEIFKPETTDELVNHLLTNTTEKYRIGAGLTGVSGGAVPEKNETYIDLSGLNKLEWFDENTGVLISEPGVTMLELKKFTENKNWFFPVIPGSLQKATIGGLVACNGGGPLSLKYGKIGNYVLGLEVTLPDGKKILTGGYSTKISEGIQEKSIWIGSEGTLGIITKIILKCLPVQDKLFYYRISSSNRNDLLNAIPNVLKLDPHILEFAEKDALVFSSKVDEHVIWTAFRDKKELSSLNNNLNIILATEEIMSERFSIGHNLQTYKPFIDLDVSFPVKHAPIAIDKLKLLLDANKLENIVFGHAGDGNYHIHLFFNDDKEKWNTIVNEFDSIIAFYQGQISGEHGIGKVHAQRFKSRVQIERLELYFAIKKQLDPNNQLPSLF